MGERQSHVVWRDESLSATQPYQGKDRYCSVRLVYDMCTGCIILSGGWGEVRNARTTLHSMRVYFEPHKSFAESQLSHNSHQSPSGLDMYVFQKDITIDATMANMGASSHKN